MTYQKELETNGRVSFLLLFLVWWLNLFVSFSYLFLIERRLKIRSRFCRIVKLFLAHLDVARIHSHTQRDKQRLWKNRMSLCSYVVFFFSLSLVSLISRFFLLFFSRSFSTSKPQLGRFLAVSDEDEEEGGKKKERMISIEKRRANIFPCYLQQKFYFRFKVFFPQKIFVFKMNETIFFLRKIESLRV